MHQPLGGGRSTADTDGFGSFEPFGTQLRSLFDVIAAGIGPATHFEKDPAVARLAAADEDNYVESPCELLEVTFAIGYLAADRVVGEDLRRVGGPAAHPVAQVLEQGDALRGLRKEIDRTCEVDLVEVFLCFDDQRGSFDLPRLVNALDEAILEDSCQL